MFTGIITDIGTVEKVTPLEEGIKLRVATNYDRRRSIWVPRSRMPASA